MLACRRRSDNREATRPQALMGYAAKRHIRGTDTASLSHGKARSCAAVHRPAVLELDAQLGAYIGDKHRFCRFETGCLLLE